MLGRASSSTALIVGGLDVLHPDGNIATIWPMFGIANQLLACTALCVGTTILLREAPKRVYALVTLVPLALRRDDDDHRGRRERRDALPPDDEGPGDAHDRHRERCVVTAASSRASP